MSGNSGAPLPVTTVIVRRQCYPRVPPELLLREHAGKFRLTGLTLASLLDAISPRANPVLPPFVARTDVSGGATAEFMDTLLKGIAKRPPVPRENVKELGPLAQRMEREAAEAKRRANAASPTPSSATALGGQEVPQDEQNYSVFDQAASSRLTVFEIVRRTNGSRKASGKATVQDEHDVEARHSMRSVSTHHDPALEEYEAVWGYDTGAVVHMNLHAFADDLHVRRQYAALPPRRRGMHLELQQSKEGKVGVVDELDHSSSSIMEQQESSTESDVSGEEFDDVFYSLSERAPRGVSLLGYHPVGGVCCIVYDARNDLAISGGADGTLLVWDLHQRYRTALRERYNKEEETRNARPTQQFSTYVHTRRLAQNIRHAHSGGISTLATHCELLISGGVDGTVKVWASDEPASAIAHSAPPLYVGRQVFRCGGWIRHIWCSPGRNVQGEDVLVSSESGCITGFRGFTVSQQPLLQSPKGRRKTLLDALRNPHGPLTKPESDIKQKTGSPPTGGIPLSSRTGAKESYGQDEDSVRKKDHSENRALRLLHRGLISRALRMTRTLQTLSEEARLASAPGSRFRVKEESTSAITRLIPLVERNLFITVGYSPLVRFLDMTRLGVAAVVEHPSLSAAGGGSDGKRGGGTQSTSTEQQQQQQQEGGKMQYNNSSNSRTVSNGEDGVTNGNDEALRFIDLLYVSSCDYLLLLDNRNTVFVWDNASNAMLTSWTVPTVSDGGKRNIALRLMPCGTRHYESAGANNGIPTRRRKMYRPQRRVACFYQQRSDIEEALKVEDEEPMGAIKIPFFVACTMGMELCDVEIAEHARLEFKAHEDAIVGIFLRPGAPLPSRDALKAHTHTLLGNEILKESVFPKKHGPLLCTAGARAAGSAGTFRFGDGIHGCGDKDSINTQEDELKSTDTASSWFQQSLREADDGDRLRMISCSVDGAIRFWGDSFEPIRAYHHQELSKEADLCTTIPHKPLEYDGALSPFEVPPRVIRNKRSGSALEVQIAGCDDTTSVYFSNRWHLVVTGHDDGSIRYWPCDQQVATCAWHKGLHRNTVSGLVGAHIARSEGRRRTVARQKPFNEDSGRTEPIELLATVSFDGYLAVWEYPEQAKAQPHGRTRVSQNELHCVSFDETNKLFIVGDGGGTITSWDARDLEPRRSIPSRPPSPWRPANPPPHLVFLPRPQQQPQLRKHGSFMQPAKKKRVGHTEAVTTLLVDGNFVFSGGEDGRVILWDMNAGVLVREYFLLHDTGAIAEHRRRSESISNMYSSTIGSNHDNPRSTLPGGLPAKAVSYHRPGEVASLALLKRRRGDLIAATREGWLYHFHQHREYPHSTYRHNSPIRCICVTREGREGDEESDSVEEPGEDGGCLLDGGDRSFEVAVGGEGGRIALVRETCFSAAL